MTRLDLTALCCFGSTFSPYQPSLFINVYQLKHCIPESGVTTAGQGYANANGLLIPVVSQLIWVFSVTDDREESLKGFR